MPLAFTSNRAACGIEVVSSTLSSTRESVAAVKSGLVGTAFQHIIAFFSIEHDPEVLVAELAEAFPDTPVSGCSTAGEIGPSGMMQGGLVILAFPEEGFRVLSEAIPAADQPGLARATEIARRLKVQISDGNNRQLSGQPFAIMLIDGLSNKEEALTAAVHWGLDSIELIGGSSGDGLAFRRTALLHNGRMTRASALLFVIESIYPFQVFKTQNFEPTPVKLVVTAANTENRVVYELNAEPAAREYAAAIGLLPDELGPFSFASYPLVVKVGGDYYCRSIRNMNPDGSLSFFCAIDEGLVFTVARPRDMVRSTLDTLDRIDAELGGTDLVIGFDCILRRLDAESRQVRHQVDETYRRFGVAGFHTYGEQYNAMHLNQTLTGIAFAKSPAGS
ncbi:MAG: FIST N-terminal domain-containing protein [Hyphomicrobium sp.]